MIRSLYRVSYDYKAFQLISTRVTSVPELRFTYKGVQVDQLTATKLVFLTFGPCEAMLPECG